MAAIGTLPVLFSTGDHASRPAASAVGKGGLYSCTTHSLVYQTDGSSWSTWASLSGTGLADPMTTRGDTIYRNASNVTDRLAIPAAGQVLGRSGSDLGAVYPPGYEYAYAQRTTNLSVTATTEGTADTGMTASAVAFDGSTIVLVEVWANHWGPGVSASVRDIRCWLYDDTGGGAASIGFMAYEQMTGDNSNVQYVGLYGARRITPSAATHTYSARFSVSNATGTVAAGAGGITAVAPAFIRITKVA